MAARTVPLRPLRDRLRHAGIERTGSGPPPPRPHPGAYRRDHLRPPGGGSETGDPRRPAVLPEADRGGDSPRLRGEDLLPSPGTAPDAARRLSARAVPAVGAAGLPSATRQPSSNSATPDCPGSRG